MSDSARLVGDGFQLRFERRADRYAQVIELQQGEGYECAAESIEGAGDEAWPASPPLQDLHIEQRDGGAQVALLVGRAGRSHWSLSIELATDGRELLFDAACRTGDKPRWLGSTYKLVQPSFIACECGDGAENTRAIGAMHELAISANLKAAENGQTVRWQYRLMVQRPTAML